MARKTNQVEAAKAKTEKVEAAKSETNKVKAVEANKFSKKQFLASNKFAKRRDLVNALLKDNESYSIKEVEDLINDFLYGKK